MSIFFPRFKAAVSLACLALVGCSVGPDYHEPKIADLPMDWHWQKASPQDQAPKGPWWKIFHDPNLDAFEEQALGQSPDLRAAVARVEEARARVRLQGASFLPTLAFDPSAMREQFSANEPQFAKVPFPAIHQRLEPSNSFTVPLDLNYEIDLWGRVRRSFEAATALAQASIADYQNVLLTLTSDVAADYLTVQEYDAEIKILQDTVKSRELSLRINHTRVKAGRATQVDVSQAETQLTNAESELAGVQRDRAHTVDALAVLCGAMASNFFVSEHPLDIVSPRVPVGLPASLLQRRPDVAEAERTMAAANAQIGVAYAAFFPAVTLTGQAGYLSASAATVFDWPSTIWSFGPTVRLPLFDGGERLANLKIARVTYDENVANYRKAVLGSVRDVEDALADIRLLRKQRMSLDKSAASARQVTDLLMKEFKVGQINYTDVTVAQQTQLDAERTSSQIKGQQLYATVRLIKALGGGWDEAPQP